MVLQRPPRKGWKADVLKGPCMRKLPHVASQEEFVHQLVHPHSLKPTSLSGGELTETDFKRLKQNASDDLAVAVRMMEDLKKEMKRLGMHV